MSSGEVGGVSASATAAALILLTVAGGGGGGGGGGYDLLLSFGRIRMTGTSPSYFSLLFARILGGMATSPWSVTRWPGGSRGGRGG